MKVRELMETAMGQQAADLHLQTGRPPMMRLAQGLCPLPGPPLSEGDLRQVLQAVGWSGGDQGDGAFSWHDALRCRLHVCREYAGLHVTIRFLYPLASLPPDGDGPLLQRLSCLTSGLVLVCGPTGSGKTTALWRILQAINERRPCHIVTLEDPIEYVEAGKAALITQRELGTHFATFAEGIRQALRQDPDVILIGEMRDRAAMDAALTAAETGHFVLSTLHTPSAAQAVSRLAMVLQAILAQRRLERQGRIDIVREVLVRTPAVVQLIRSGKEYQLPTVMQTGAALGMRTMEQALRRCGEGGTS
ncbi:type IV pilus twitching motility protein PilT [Megasphaera sp.]|uniref:type IV pilus twitching motility protein PilT n=1 Tax=Megasphaera sp. TaxID=2023260 RepID=UPI0040256FFD